MRSAALLLALAACVHPHDEDADDSEVVHSDTEPGLDSDDPDAPVGALVFAEPVEGRLVVRGADEADPRVVPMDGEPTGVQQLPDRVLVTLRTAGDVVELSPVDDGLRELRRVHVGVEPHQVRADPSSPDHVFVTDSLDYAISRYDLDTGERTFRAELDCETRYLAVIPGTEADPRLMVTCAYSPWFYEVTPSTGDVVKRALPELSWPRTDNGCGEEPYAPRITGNPIFDASGTVAYLPAWFVANLALPVCDREWYFTHPNEYFPSLPPEQAGRASRMMPVLLVWPLDGSEPTAVNLTSPLPAESVVLRAMPNQVFRDPRRDDVLWVSSEINGAVYVVDLSRPTEEQGAGPFVNVRRALVDAALGARDVRFGDGKAWIWSWIGEGSLSTVDLDALPLQGSWPEVVDAEVVGSVESTLTAEERRGQVLVYDARDPQAAVPGTGVTCYTCHVDGRLDGLQWEFGVGAVVNTLRLSGSVVHYPNMTWAGKDVDIVGEVKSVSRFTVQPPILGDDAAALGAYVARVRDPLPVPPEDDAEAAQVAEGKALFEREDVGCSRCHYGDDMTSWEIVTQIPGQPTIRVPPLHGLRATPPYLHDGRVGTLRAFFDHNVALGLGNTTSLTEDEKQALVAYLISL